MVGGYFFTCINLLTLSPAAHFLYIGGVLQKSKHRIQNLVLERLVIGLLSTSSRIP